MRVVAGLAYGLAAMIGYGWEAGVVVGLCVLVGTLCLGAYVQAALGDAVREIRTEIHDHYSPRRRRFFPWSD